ncbi:hypothetical protein O181_088792 [Austropuccinia psidii MF-1]|uniref:Integrase zinc-binding domain-containing protein n=1 Tax=Austropuccinia psidii MF-1 TaxID=1389203 RepID=A0A9Q3ISC2_9BASI|nr:hypothetical protein [Austropuccinia psidii MF-1]
MTSVSLSPRKARWTAFLSPFSSCIALTPGRANPADPPSWRADYIPDSTTTNVPILQMINPSTVPNPSPSPISLGMIGTSQPSLLRPDPHFVFPSPAELSRLLCLGLGFEPTCQEVWRDAQGFSWHQGRLFVPQAGRQLVFATFHSSPTGGHQGLAHTLSVFTQTFSWPGLWQELVDFISTCDSCQQAKALRKVPAGLLKSLPVPSQPWSSIGMDFIVKLPKSCGFDAILVIVDLYTKGAHLVPCNEAKDSPKLATIFID